MEKFIKLAAIACILFYGAKGLGIGPFAGNSGDNHVIVPLLESAKAAGKDKVVVLLTGTKWCPACKELDRKVIRTDLWRSFIDTEVHFESYDYAANGSDRFETKGDILEFFNIEGFPTMIVLDTNGKVLGKQAGFIDGGSGYYERWIKSL